jgi:hypothetical protein
MIILSVIFLVTLSFGCIFLSCSSKKIDSYDLLVGEWDTTVRFPQKVLQQFKWEEVFASTSSVKPLRRATASGSCNFRLSVYQNGTFGMVPLNSLNNSPAELCIRGKWMLQTNPYCVTDRFYDNLYLESYPRVQKMMYEFDDGFVNGSDVLTTQKLRLKLKCRLCGHFTGRRLRFRDRHYYARGMLTHGIILWENLKSESMDSSPSRLWKIVRMFRRPKIEASFSARRYLPYPSDFVSVTNECDEVEFGY